MRLSKRFYHDVAKKLKSDLKILAEDIANEMQKEIDNIPNSGSYDAVGASSWRESVKKAIKSQIAHEVNAACVNIGLINPDDLTLQRALLINYGMGVYLDSSNPFLGEYKSSKYYDNKRTGNRVYTRPGEMVFDYYSGSFIKSKAETRSEIVYFKQYPSFFYENALVELRIKINHIIDNLLNTIDISTYIL